MLRTRSAAPRFRYGMPIRMDRKWIEHDVTPTLLALFQSTERFGRRLHPNAAGRTAEHNFLLARPFPRGNDWWPGNDPLQLQDMNFSAVVPDGQHRTVTPPRGGCDRAIRKIM